MLGSFAIFALAFIARPFGTALFMGVQRKLGVGTKLSAALFLLGFSTVCIAFVPGYAVIGGWSIFLLALLRLMQGFAQGGSWDGLASLLALSVPAKKHGRYAAMVQLGDPVGAVIATSLYLYLHMQLSEADFTDWGWRYPFFVLFAINVVALFARLRLVIAREYAEQFHARALAPVSVREVFGHQRHVVWLGAFSALASCALYYLVTIFPLSWVSMHNLSDIDRILSIQVIGAFFFMAGMIASGWIADRVGRNRTLAGAAVLIGVYGLVAPWLLDGHTAQAVFIVLGFTLLGLSYGQSAGLAAPLFSTHLRYTGAAITTDMAWLIGAAFAPLTVLTLSNMFGLVSLTGYLISGVVCTLVSLRLTRSLLAGNG
ncbi:MFS transporter [Burkholderia alba]|nr:MFS transporter [Burkholderia alba]